MRKTQIECIVFRRKRNKLEFLLLKRIPSKGGFWQPPCGGVEESDGSVLEAVYRELLEEVNIPREKIIKVFENVYEFQINKHYLTGEDISPIKEYVFGIEIESAVEVSINKNIYPEHENFKWCNYEEAISSLKWEDNKTAFKRLNELLNKE